MCPLHPFCRGAPLIARHPCVPTLRVHHPATLWLDQHSGKFIPCPLPPALEKADGLGCLLTRGLRVAPHPREPGERGHTWLVSMWSPSPQDGRTVGLGSPVHWDDSTQHSCLPPLATRAGEPPHTAHSARGVQGRAGSLPCSPRPPAAHPAWVEHGGHTCPVALSRQSPLCGQ